MERQYALWVAAAEAGLVEHQRPRLPLGPSEEDVAFLADIQELTA